MTHLMDTAQTGRRIRLAPGLVREHEAGFDSIRYLNFFTEHLLVEGGRLSGVILWTGPSTP
jgi:hypothetical protein